LEALIPYIEAELAAGARLSDMTRHMLGLFAGRPGARRWRQHLSARAVQRGAGVETLREALAYVSFAPDGGEDLPKRELRHDAV
jgi:tRNA-dihydrouridine synthase A